MSGRVRKQGRGLALVCSLSSFLHLCGSSSGLAGQWPRALVQDDGGVGRTGGEMEGREGKVWVFSVIEEVRGGGSG